VNKVSVVMPCFNGEKFVKQAIESVLAQTFKNFEIVFVDDGSTDKSLEIVEGFKNSKIRVVKNPVNLGIGASKTKGILEARGKYLCFLSVDDLYEPNYLEEMLKNVEENTICFSNYRIINEVGIVTHNFLSPKFEYYEDWVINQIELAKKNTMSTSYNTVFAKTSLWKKNLFWSDKRIGEDLAHLLECLLVKKIRFKHVEKFLLKYRLSPQQETYKKLGEIVNNNQDTFKRINELVGKAVF